MINGKCIENKRYFITFKERKYGDIYGTWRTQES